jgi:probable HAF family extracellular repeat protein
VSIYIFSQFDAPSAVVTEGWGVNSAGQIVGDYRPGSLWTNGFLYSNGTYTTINDPLATTSSIAYGINDAGQIIGDYEDGNHGFLYNPSSGTFTTLNNPGNNGTFWRGINASGQIVGYFLAGSFAHGFLYNLSSGTFTTLDDPLGTNGTQALGINNLGQIVGSYIDASRHSHGFLYNGRPLPPSMIHRAPTPLRPASTISARSSGLTAPSAVFPTASSIAAASSPPSTIPWPPPAPLHMASTTMVRSSGIFLQTTAAAAMVFLQPACRTRRRLPAPAPT